MENLTFSCTFRWKSRTTPLPLPRSLWSPNWLTLCRNADWNNWKLFWVPTLVKHSNQNASESQLSCGSVKFNSKLKSEFIVPDIRANGHTAQFWVEEKFVKYLENKAIYRAKNLWLDLILLLHSITTTRIFKTNKTLKKFSLLYVCFRKFQINWIEALPDCSDVSLC